MKTEYRLAHALKDLMSSNKSLDDISVTLLSKKCKVNRQTFYYHFHDIYDLLTLVFLQEEIPYANESKNHIELLTKIYEYYHKNANFIDSVLESAGKDLFVEFINNICYQSFLRMVVIKDKDKKITLPERKSIARFSASGFAYQVTFYFQNTKRKSLDGLLANFTLLGEDFIQGAMQNVINAKKSK